MAGLRAKTVDLGPERGGRRKHKGEKKVQRPWCCLFVPFVMGPRSPLDNVHVTHCLFPPALTPFSPGCKDSYPSCSETDTEVTRGRRLTPRGLPSVGRGHVGTSSRKGDRSATCHRPLPGDAHSNLLAAADRGRGLSPLARVSPAVPPQQKTDQTQEV